MADDNVFIRKTWLDEGVAGTLQDVRDVLLVLRGASKLLVLVLGYGCLGNNVCCYSADRWPRPVISKLDIIRLNLAAIVLGADPMDSIFNVAENTFGKGSVTTK